MCHLVATRDLAKLYQVETKRINEAVSRNKEKFPERFSFVLNDFDLETLRSQFATSNINIRGGRRYSIRVFTEQGVAMLSSVIHTDVAIKVSIAIVDAFVAMKKYISTNLLEQKYINDMVLKHDSQIIALEESFNKLEEKKKTNEIYFDGQIYDAYFKI